MEQSYNENYQNPKSQKQHNKGSKGKKKGIKIKYISSPMMFRANNASEFRAIVQELTGQNSHVTSDHDFESHVDTHHHDDQMIMPSWNFPTHDHDHGYSKSHDRDIDDHENSTNSEPNRIGGFGVPLIGSQFEDEANHYWRSELVSDQSLIHSGTSGFQLSSCVFV